MQLLRLPSAGSAARRSGFTLIELVVATTVLVVGMLGVVGTLTTVSTLGGSNRESTLAYQAARSVMESLQSEDFVNVFRRFNEDPGDDPDGPGTAPGASFAVAGLGVQQGDADGLTGRILFPVSAGNLLREDLVDDSFNMPMDLNGDGAVDGFDHTDDHVLLPVRIRVEWAGQSGDRFVEFSNLLGRRR